MPLVLIASPGSAGVKASTSIDLSRVPAGEHSTNMAANDKTANASTTHHQPPAESSDATEKKRTVALIVLAVFMVPILQVACDTF